MVWSWLASYKKLLSIVVAFIFIGTIIGFIVYLSIMLIPCPSCPVVKNVIEISNNWQLKKHADSGSGSEEDPYIIENRVLGSTIEHVRYMYIALEITGTSKHFTIRNCTFYGGSPGVLIDSISSSTGILENCSFITVYQTDWDNVIPSGGLIIEKSDGIILRNNTHIGSDYSTKVSGLGYDYGLIIENCDGYMIEDSWIQCDTGIANSPNGEIRYNKIGGSVELYLSSNIDLSKNNFTYMYLQYYGLDYEPTVGSISILECSDIYIYDSTLNASWHSKVISIKDSQSLYIMNNTIYVYETILFAENVFILHIINNTIFRGTKYTIQFELIDCTVVVNQDNIIYEPNIELIMKYW